MGIVLATRPANADNESALATPNGRVFPTAALAVALRASTRTTLSPSAKDATVATTAALSPASRAAAIEMGATARPAEQVPPRTGC
jgi:hypothetical protein